MNSLTRCVSLLVGLALLATGCFRSSTIVQSEPVAVQTVVFMDRDSDPPRICRVEAVEVWPSTDDFGGPALSVEFKEGQWPEIEKAVGPVVGNQLAIIGGLVIASEPNFVGHLGQYGRFSTWDLASKLDDEELLQLFEFLKD